MKVFFMEVVVKQIVKFYVGNFILTMPQLVRQIPKNGWMIFLLLYLNRKFRWLSIDSRFIFSVFCSLAPFVAAFLFHLQYKSYWRNFEWMFYRLPNLGASPFRSTSFRTYIFIIIFILTSHTHPCPRSLHRCWWRMLRMKWVGDKLNILVTDLIHWKTST